MEEDSLERQRMKNERRAEKAGMKAALFLDSNWILVYSKWDSNGPVSTLIILHRGKSED